MSTYLFHDRADAGMRLAKELTAYQNDPNTIVLGIPRGGVPVAFAIAKKLRLPLDIFMVRKLGAPNQAEFAMGAIASGNGIFLNDDVILNLAISKKELNKIIESEKKELNRRELCYRQNRAFPNLNNKKIILVDDGIATGSSMHSAIMALQKLNPKEIIIAVPVAPESTIKELSLLVDHIYCIYPAAVFHAVGQFYDDFSQMMDEEVIYCLNESCQALSQKPFPAAKLSLKS